MSVAILMGSDSDLPRLEPCFQQLRDLGVKFEARVLSAHRTPAQVVDFVTKAPARGIKVFICAAGGAAHLAGVMAAKTALPVLGVPLVSGSLNGLDALLSTVQMPGGVPVAAFGAGVGGPVNAALFACRVIALSDKELAARMAKFRDSQMQKVLAKDAALQDKLAGPRA
jgi:phosphoribosylaminoimidazole carboxylase PurE protein